MRRDDARQPAGLWPTWATPVVDALNGNHALKDINIHPEKRSGFAPFLESWNWESDV
jgi:hypothetical protein